MLAVDHALRADRGAHAFEAEIVYLFIRVRFAGVSLSSQTSPSHVRYGPLVAPIMAGGVRELGGVERRMALALGFWRVFLESGVEGGEGRGALWVEDGGGVAYFANDGLAVSWLTWKVWLDLPS